MSATYVDPTFRPARSVRQVRLAAPAATASCVHGEWEQHDDAPVVSSYEPQYRLTRRGRAVVLVLSLLAVLVAGVAFAAGSVATDENERTATVVVVSGDTLWGIASEAAGDGDDVKSMMRHIEELNDLDDVVLLAGQRLVVPVHE